MSKCDFSNQSTSNLGSYWAGFRDGFFVHELSSTVYYDNDEQYNSSMEEKKVLTTTGDEITKLSQPIIDYLKKSNVNVEMGDAIDLSPLYKVRELEQYNDTCFNSIVSMLSETGKKKLLYELAQLSYDALFAFEIEFVVECIKSDDLELQEYALNALEIWENKDLVKKIGKIKIKHKYLQAEYDALMEKLS